MKYLAIVLFALSSATASAMDVKTYQALSASAPEASIDPTVETYLAGVGDALQAQRDPKGKVSFLFDGKPFELCAPSEFPMHPKLLKRIVDMQLRDTDKLASQVGPDWQSAPVAALVISGLKRTFVCAR